MPIPTTVTIEQLREAVKPLYDLLGTSLDNVYAYPGTIIQGDSITFSVSAEHESDPSGKAPHAKAANHPQGVHGVHVYNIHVGISRASA